MAGLDSFAGTGNLRFAVTSQGSSIADLVRGLDGEGLVLARDGAILGINIGATVRQVMTLGAVSTAGEPRRTDFAEAGGSFTIEDGVLANEDFALRAPVLRVTGAGTVDLGAQTLVYRLLPQLASTSKGRTRRARAPFRPACRSSSRAPWDDPRHRLDLGGALSGDISDPAALANFVGSIAADPGGWSSSATLSASPRTRPWAV